MRGAVELKKHVRFLPGPLQLALTNHEQALAVWLPVSQSALSSIILTVPWPPACIVTGKFTNAWLIFNLLPSHPAHILAYVIMMTALDRTLLWTDFIIFLWVFLIYLFCFTFWGMVGWIGFVNDDTRLRDGRVRVEYFFIFFFRGINAGLFRCFIAIKDILLICLFTVKMSLLPNWLMLFLRTVIALFTLTC